MNITITQAIACVKGGAVGILPLTMESLDYLLTDLNEEQRAAVTAPPGPLLIVAGAGTGKTTVITRRIAWLILSGTCKPDEILAVTFTDKAAGEMEERVDRLLPYGYVNLWIMTFHAFCERMLQRHGLDIGLPNDFTLLDQTSAWLLVRQNLDRFDLDYYRPLGNPSKFIHALISHFSRAKDEDISPQAYLEYAQTMELDTDHESNTGAPEDLKRIREIADAYHVYQQLLLENNSLDFGDLITYALRLFRQRPALLAKYQKQFHTVLVDEFQDTNFAQYELINMLAAPRSNLTVVGDDDQAIFRFRGASYQNIVQFKKDYPDSREIALTRNYRSSQNILDCSYQFIKRNDPYRLECQLAGYGNSSEYTGASRGELSKRLKAHHDYTGVISHIHRATLDEEVESVIDAIIEIKSGDPQSTWSDFAILARANTSAHPFLARLSELEIPYQFLSMRGLYAKPVILDLLAYCRVLVNYHEGPALYRVLCWPHLGISTSSLIELGHAARRKGMSLFDACVKPETVDRIAKHDRDAIASIVGNIQKHADLARGRKCAELLVHILRDTGYLAFLKDADTLEKRDALDYLNQLYKKMYAFGTQHPDARLKDFLQLISYEQEAGDSGRLRAASDGGPDSVKVMTIHASKGLEFPHVFIVNMVDRRFPTVEREDAIPLPEGLAKELVPEGDVHLQEERRLCYVALTRAKQSVHFTSSRDYGGTRAKKPSVFLYEIGLLEQASDARHSDTKTGIEDDVLSKSDRGTPKQLASLSAYPIPTVYSFTQLAAFRTCPLQYKFAFLLNIPIFGKAQFSFGKTLHLTLQRYGEQIIERGSRAQAALFRNEKKEYTDTGAIYYPPYEDLLAIYEKSWHDDWFATIHQKEQYRAKGRELLKAFYDDLIVSRPLIHAVEQDFTMKVGERDALITIKGRIDRIDRLQEGVAIVDYKTGGEKKDETLRSQDKEQLLLYQIAVEEIMHEKPLELTYYYLGSGKKISFLGTEKEKQALKRRITKTISELKKSDFSPTPGWHCKSCDFKDICEYRQL
ncbi:UvrD-helicase domain-containing protein [Candidatus Uhrbacteria bacterium]|nr:UvrD-helicase domain-containing protein [Candidatus Uhrbacteria bacterium]